MISNNNVVFINLNLIQFYPTFARRKYYKTKALQLWNMQS